MAFQPHNLARRRVLLKRAISGDTDDATRQTPAPQAPPRAVTGTVLDASPHVLVVDTGASEERFALMDTTSAWRGKRITPAALSPGQHVVIRRYGHTAVADRIWADIGRITGTILERTGSELLVDQGHGRGRGVLILSPGSAAQILVRFPKLEPGYLIDVIGLRRGGIVAGIVPATSQPPYHSTRVPRAALVRGHVPKVVSGTASWYEPADEPEDAQGTAYPALDPESGCGDDAGSCDAAVSCARLPYLSIGSILMIHNDCAARFAAVQVTACGSTASHFCDRCLTCGMSPRGRIVDLTMASYVELGGELDKGCFNATITIGG